jgi:hypothetical protein
MSRCSFYVVKRIPRSPLLTGRSRLTLRPLGAAASEDADDLDGVGGGQAAAPGVNFSEAKAVEFVDGFCIGGWV